MGFPRKIWHTKAILTLGYIENAKHNVSLQKLCEIANVLEMDVVELFKPVNKS